MTDPVPRIAAALTARHQTLATVECSLGGALGGALTEVAGASAWFVGCVAPYAAGAKQALLGIGPDQLGADGAVSPLAARLLARAARERLGADWALAETGIAGPRGQRRSAKEPGTVYLALVGPDGLEHELERATGLDDRSANRRAFLAAALELISTNVEMSVV
jgi:nicotinamide-nucleotide amidase